MRGREGGRGRFSIGMSCLEVSCEYIGSHNADDVDVCVCVCVCVCGGGGGGADVQHRDVLFGGVLYITISM